MISININVSKIDKTALFAGKQGKYLNLVLHDNKEGEDQWGNMGFVTQDLGKDRRLAGERSAILGNFKYVGQKPTGIVSPEYGKRETSQGGAPPPSRTATADALDEPEDDIPF